jgi:carboxypeptidase C (cathepsin A)
MTDNAEAKVPAQDPAAAKAGNLNAEDPKDDLVTTRHVITTDGAQLRYTVTAGRVVLRQEGHTDDKFDGAEAKAEVFMVAYTLDDAGAPAAARSRSRSTAGQARRASGCTSACSARGGC